MHRISSLYNPDAPLSHHWNDATHITFGVATAGIRFGMLKADVSSFTGTEPNKNRYNFDKPRFDSYSGRLTLNPNPFWSFQLAQGFIKHPESTRPKENINRTTASITYSKPLSNNNFINITTLWGLNHSHDYENAALMEAAWIIRRLAIYGRYEYIQKSIEELNLSQNEYGQNLFIVMPLTVGFNFNLAQFNLFHMAIGAQGSYYWNDNRLTDLYGKHPVSAEIFIRLYPPRM